MMLEFKNTIKSIKYPELLGLVVISFVLHFAFLFNPPLVVTDEYHFVNFTESYLKGEYFFDIHPPFGKMVLAGFASVIGLPHTEKIQEASRYPDKKFMWLRIVPALCGVLLVLVVWLIVFKFMHSRIPAFLAGFFVTFDNALLLQSRLVLIDSLLLLMMFLGILFLLSGKWKSSGVFFGLAGSIKWTGWGALLSGWLWLFKNSSHLKIPKGEKALALFGVLPFFVYFSIFAVHLYSLTSLNGSAWLSFNKLVSKIEILKPPSSGSLLGAFFETNVYMLAANIGVPSHPGQSPFWSWPFGGSPFWYYYDGISTLGLIANLALWWLGLCAIIIACVLLFKQNFRSSAHGKASIFFLMGFFANWFPFLFINRPMFLYHYFPALVFEIMVLSVLVDYFIETYPRYKTSIMTSVVGSVVVSFILIVQNTFIAY